MENYKEYKSKLFEAFMDAQYPQEVISEKFINRGIRQFKKDFDDAFSDHFDNDSVTGKFYPTLYKAKIGKLNGLDYLKILGDGDEEVGGITFLRMILSRDDPTAVVTIFKKDNEELFPIIEKVFNKIRWIVSDKKETPKAVIYHYKKDKLF